MANYHAKKSSEQRIITEVSHSYTEINDNKKGDEWEKERKGHPLFPT